MQGVLQLYSRKPQPSHHTPVDRDISFFGRRNPPTHIDLNRFRARHARKNQPSSQNVDKNYQYAQ